MTGSAAVRATREHVAGLPETGPEAGRPSFSETVIAAILADLAEEFLADRDNGYIMALPLAAAPHAVSMEAASTTVVEIVDFELVDGTRFAHDGTCWVVTHRPCPVCRTVLAVERVGVTPTVIPAHAAPLSGGTCAGVTR